MCGIAGFIDAASGSNAGTIAEAMAKSIAYRGPDDQGIWTDGVDDGQAVGKTRHQLAGDEKLPFGFRDAATVSDIAAEHQFGDHLGLLRAVALRHRGLRAGTGCGRSDESEAENSKAGDAHRSNTSP